MLTGAARFNSYAAEAPTSRISFPRTPASNMREGVLINSVKDILDEWLLFEKRHEWELQVICQRARQKHDGWCGAPGLFHGTVETNSKFTQIPLDLRHNYNRAHTYCCINTFYPSETFVFWRFSWNAFHR